ncbi:MAG: gamma-glutamyl-gamma-aminobutyrate hydrolase family protein [Proteobacteria bacterium]|nr:gamma-glutamyl-gamma-aminobutyrate hydrolase family protein [Pseudomonadota bacterium]
MHQEHSRPGRVGGLLEKRGYELHRLCPNLGCNLPEDMSGYAGVVIFGGPMSANDCGTLAGIKCELDWIPKVVEAGVPFLGLCLGAQLLTRAVGGHVAPRADGLVEVGYSAITPTAAGQAWFKGPMKVYEWHREGMDVPASCEVLAGSELYPVQAFRYRENAFGFQFHPEVTLEMKDLWTSKATESLKRPGAQPRGVHLSMHTLYDPPLDRWINGFLDRWLATDQRSVSATGAAAPRLLAAAE